MSCLRPLSLSNDDKGEEPCGEMGDCIGVESGDDEAESEVLSLVVKVRKMGIVDDLGFGVRIGLVSLRRVFGRQWQDYDLVPNVLHISRIAF